QGTPEQLVAEAGAVDLEEAFVGVLESAQPDADADNRGEMAAPSLPHADQRVPRFDSRRLLAWAGREWRELWREPVRLVFALAGPVFLMLILGYGINFDVENLRFASLDQDQSPASRDLLAALGGSRYF